MSNAPVTLPLAMARCPNTRTEPCGRASSCARALASAPGRQVQDYSIEQRDSHGACVHYLSAEQYRAQSKAAVKPPHDFVKGLI